MTIQGLPEVFAILNGMSAARTIRVKVIAGAKKEKVEGTGNSYVISVKEPAERNLANTRVREIIARTLKLPIRRVRFSTGARSPNKRFEIIS
jgi:uncharacterized protein YggU (UPF0235/DUF167 family)